MKRRLTSFLAMAVMLAPITGLSVILPDIVGSVTAGSYSNRLAALFTSAGDSRGFSNTGDPRLPAYQHDAARDYILTSFQEMGYDAWLTPFSFFDARFPPGNFAGCNNVVAVKRGFPGTNVYVVGAHYDTIDLNHLGSGSANITNACAGADDNGSGVAAIMETACAIKDITFRDTIIFIAFDAEEKGLYGSQHFVDNFTTDNPAATNNQVVLRSSIKGMLNIDTVGHDDTNTPPLIIVGSIDANTNSPTERALMESAERHSRNIGIQDWGWVNSDHKPFQEAGVDTGVLTEYDFVGLREGSGINWDDLLNHNYHSDSDHTGTPGNISYGYATEVTRIVVGYLCEQARAIVPATLDYALPDANTFALRWRTVPGVSYTLFASASLVDTNGWTSIGRFEGINGISSLTIELDLSSSAHRMFKVESD